MLISLSLVNTSIFKKYYDPIRWASPYAIPNDTMNEIIELIASKNGCFIKVEFEFLCLDEPYSKHRNPNVNINKLIVTCIFYYKMTAHSMDMSVILLVYYLKIFEDE